MRVTLGIDTSTLVGSVAVVSEDRLLCETTIRVRASHGESLLAVVDQVMAAASVRATDLMLLSYARGPGSFTGVRIGMATLKGLALVTGAPTLGVSSLEALAMHCAGAAGLVCPVMDARKGEVYGAAYRMTPAGPEVVLAEHAATPEAFAAALAAAADSAAAREEPLHLLGDGLEVYGRRILPALGDRVRTYPAALTVPRGAFVAHLAGRAFAAGAREDLATAAPTYLRPPDAEYKVPKLVR